MYETLFYDYSSNLCDVSNTQAAYLIDGDEVEKYTKSLTITDAYKAWSDKLSRYSKLSSTKYFYIMADTGVQGQFTYIFDNSYSDIYTGRYVLGVTESKENFEGGAEVLATGEAFEKARYYSGEDYGELFYSYAPIKNSSGETVAFVGTDIDITPMRVTLNDFRNNIIFWSVCVLGLFALAFVGVLTFMLRRPLVQMIKSADRMAEGDLTPALSDKIVNRRDEIGQLAQTFVSFGRSLGALIESTDSMMMSARRGNINYRADMSEFKGDYRKILVSGNKTMEAICNSYDSMAEAVSFFDFDRSMVFCNVAMRRFLDLHQLGENPDTVFDRIVAASDESEGIIDGAAIFEQGNEIFEQKISLRRGASGEACHYTVSLLQVCDEDGDRACVVMTLADVSVLIRARAEAEQASRAKSDFLSHMSHEIRTPMNAIIGMTQVARRTSDPEKMRECVNKIETSSNHLLGIINDVLDMSKIEAGKLELSPVSFSLGDDLEFAVSMVAPRAREKGIKVHKDFSAFEHDYIMADSLRLNQVLMNLLSNAVKFTEVGGNITVSCKELEYDGQCATFFFAVKDSGIGISDAEMNRLFKSFQQADGSTTRRYGGTGLGLVISKNIIEMMGGSIAVSSEVGKGSTFHFTIKAPVSKAVPNDVLSSADPVSGLAATWDIHGSDGAVNTEPNGEPADVSLDSPDFSGHRALIVDDVELNRLILIELLSETQIAMEEAENGQQALDMFAAASPGYYSVILMDMQMPVLDGCDATRKIRALGRPDAASVPIVAMTANVFKEDVDKAIESGMDAHLGKPIDIDSCLRTLSRFLTDGGKTGG